MLQRSYASIHHSQTLPLTDSMPACRVIVVQVNLDQLQDLLSGAVVKPSFVQNRCYANTGWDARVRQLCKAEGITYQAFSVLTANWDAVRSPRVSAMARRLHATPEQVIFRFAHQVCALCLGQRNETDARVETKSTSAAEYPCCVWGVLILLSCQLETRTQLRSKRRNNKDKNNF